MLRERCRATALLIRVKTGESGPFFANPGHADITSQLDILLEGRMAVPGQSRGVVYRRKKKGSKSHI